MLKKVIAINEANDPALPTIDFNDSFILRINNEKGMEVDQDKFYSKLSKTNKIQNCDAVIIEHNSHLRNCRNLRIFSRLEKLVIHSKHFNSLDGIEKLESLSYLEIDSIESHKINLAPLLYTSVKKVSLSKINLVAFEILNKCEKIEELKVFRCHQFSSELLMNSNIEKLAIAESAFKKLSDLKQISKLYQLKIAYCKTLEIFDGENQNVEYLEVEVCNKLNIESIKTFSNLIELSIIGIQNAFSLKFINDLKFLRKAVLTNCAIRLTGSEKFNHNLEKIWISPLKNADIINLSLRNTKIVFTNGDTCFISGIEHPVSVFYEELRTTGTP